MKEKLHRLREALAELEHEQWASWASHMLKNDKKKKRKRWRRQIDMPYSQLSEEEKDLDREWADRVIEVLLKTFQENKETE